MKKILIAACLFCCTHIAFAQLEKGMIAVGLTSTITTSNYTNDNNSPTTAYHSTSKAFNYSILPNVNYFLSNKYSIGIQLGYIGLSAKYESNQSENVGPSSSWGTTKRGSGGIQISPNIKYYIPLNDNIYFFLQGSCSVYLANGKTKSTFGSSYVDSFSGNTINYTSDSGTSKLQTINMSAGISPGILFMPGKKIGLEFSLGNIIAYNYRLEKTTNSKTTDYIRKNKTSGLEFLNLNSFGLGTSLYYFF